MITEEQYEAARIQHDESQSVINQYHKERVEAFNERLKTNPIFKDEELFYSAASLCPCGHGLAYPKGCGGHHYWDCSAILKDIADPTVEHTGKLPFAFYSIKGESEHNGTTRGVFKPKPTTEPTH